VPKSSCQITVEFGQPTCALMELEHKKANRKDKHKESFVERVKFFFILNF
jgi:hypothetical protein